jgi:PAS domain S-box-containing protein
MAAEGIVYLLPNFFTILVSAILCVRVWQMDKLRGNRALALTIVCELIWLCGHIGKLLAEDVYTKVLWDNFEFLGTCGWPVGTLAFALQYSGARLPRIGWAVLCALPGLVFILALLDPWTGYLHPNARLVQARPFTGLLYDLRPLLTIVSLQLLVQVAFSAALVVGKSFWLTTAQRVVSLVLAAGMMIPVLMTVFVLMGIQFTEHRDTSHISFGIGNSLIFAALMLSSRESDRRFSTLFDNSGDSILILNGLVILDCNGKARQTFRGSEEDLAGRSILDLCTPDARNSEEAQWRSAADAALSGAPQFFTSVLSRRGGEEFEGEVSLSAIHFGREVVLQAVIRDRTEARTAAEEREWLIRELEAKNGELERFNYTASHDLKSPLVTIKNFVGMLAIDLESQDYEGVRDDLRRVASAADRMNDLLDDLLELSRLGRTSYPPRIVSMEQIVEETLELLEGITQARSARIILDGPLADAWADPARIKTVWQNLIENAVKYSKEDQPLEIRIGCRVQPRGTEYYVRDNGIGIDGRYHLKIFEQFHKLDAATDGSGIGLALVHRIITAHNGRVWVESDGPGRGAAFWFFLPGPPENNPRASVL